MKLVTALSLVGCLTLSAQSDRTSIERFEGLSLGISYISTQGHFREATNKSSAHGFEVNYPIISSGKYLNMRAMGGFLKGTGDFREDIDTTIDLKAWRAGVDFQFMTPLPSLFGYAGINMNFWDGKWLTASSVLGQPQGFRDAKAKFGFRVGVEYNVWDKVSLSLDYNHSEWRSVTTQSTYPIYGLNPVHPSWVAFTVKYTL